jgi:hypothetical protein
VEQDAGGEVQEGQVAEVKSRPGEQLYEIVRSVGDLVEIEHDHFIGRSAGRLIEEIVELGLACGLSAQELLGHVVNALYNESRKAKKYPTELQTGSLDAVRTELVDVTILVDYLSFLTRVVVTDDLVQTKLDKLKQIADGGGMVLVDGLMYRRESRE